MAGHTDGYVERGLVGGVLMKSDDIKTVAEELCNDTQDEKV